MAHRQYDLSPIPALIFLDPYSDLDSIKGHHVQRSLVGSHAAKISARRLRRPGHDYSPKQRKLSYQKPAATALYRCPLYPTLPCTNQQITDPFIDPNTIWSRETHNFSKFYQSQRRGTTEILLPGVKHKVCLYSIASCFAYMGKAVGDQVVPDNTAMSIKTQSLSSMRSYIDSKHYDKDIMVHALTFLCIEDCLRGDFTATKLHLSAIARVLGCDDLTSLPPHLYELVVYCDVAAARSTDSRSTLSYDAPPMQPDYSSVQNMTVLSEQIEEEMVSAGLPLHHRQLATDIVQLAQGVLITSPVQSAEIQAHVQDMYRRLFTIVTGCLDLARSGPSRCQRDRRIGFNLLLLWLMIMKPLARCKQ